MALSLQDEHRIDQALQVWHQGDFSHGAGFEFLNLTDLSYPHSPGSIQLAKDLANKGETIEAGAVPILEKVEGMVMLSQTCDVVRGCRDRPFVELAPLIKVPKAWVEEIQHLKRPAFAYIPATANQQLVADLDRTMTVEKAVVAGWAHHRGWETDEEIRSFAEALARKRVRFAFPNDFVAAADKLAKRLLDKHNRQSGEGAHLRALGEIRVGAAPSWSASEVQLIWWFIVEADPVEAPADWPGFIERWLALFDQTGRFNNDPPIACRLEDMTARDYLESDRLDLDRLSVGALSD